MGLYSEITKDVAQAFDTDLADAVYDLSLITRESNYDPNTGDPGTIDTTYLTRGVVEPVNSEHVDGEVVRIDDTTFLILRAELVMTPSVGDTIVYDLVQYSINNVAIDPARALWTIIARAV